jgi:hypothetical protein
VPTFPTAQRVRSTEDVFNHHLGAFSQGLDALVSDYTEASSILLPDRSLTGLAEIRQFFDGFLQGIQPGFWESFKVLRQTVDGEVAYLVWQAKPFVAMATDTLLVRDGHIAVQTFTPFA